jgi:chemotaxis protein methyltransferase CheR
MSLAFARLRRLVGSLVGVSLDPDKLYMAQSRLEPIMRAHGCRDLSGLMRLIERREDEALLQRVIDAMTNNETSFFRDRLPFQRLKRDWLPELMARRAETRRLRIWSAACSTGQEPYSIAIALAEMGEALAGWRVEILATDVSETALTTARRGVYSQFEAQRGLSIDRLLAHFDQKDGLWRIRDELRTNIVFRKLNLLDDCSGETPFDIVFCRNVLIYFEPAVKSRVLSRLRDRLAGDGCLILGAAETIGERVGGLSPASDAAWLLLPRPSPQPLAAIGA